MSEQETNRQNATQPVVQERCLCREVVEQVRQSFGVSPEVGEHLRNSRIEFLKAIRAVIDSRIEHLSKPSHRGAKIAVE
jgi:hypothetical protein